MKVLRTIVQFVFLAGVVTLLVRGLLGDTPHDCETYCPFGGLAALYPLARYNVYTCRLTELNVALLVSTLALGLAAKKSFCSWVCPLGTLQEWIGRAGRTRWGRWLHLPASIDRYAVFLRYGVLAAVLTLTWTVWQGDLGFRAYDPYYIIFSWNGHGTFPWSVWVAAGFLAAAFVVPFFWCRYFCPLGAVLDPFGRCGALRLRRIQERCNQCGDCDDVCPHRIPVSEMDQVTAKNCTNCMECVSACRLKALKLTWFGK